MGCAASKHSARPAPGPVPLAVETEEQRAAAKLAELRRLTPEQEAPAAAAEAKAQEAKAQ